MKKREFVLKSVTWESADGLMKVTKSNNTGGHQEIRIDCPGIFIINDNTDKNVRELAAMLLKAVDYNCELPSLK